MLDFLILQTCKENITMSSGSNSYKINRVNKEKLKRENHLPRIICKAKVVTDANYLNIIQD